MKLPLPFLAAAAMAMAAGSVLAQDLRIGLSEDVDNLDPHRGRTITGRIVFASLCDKLIDTNAKNELVPKLAKSWAWSQGDKVLTLTLRDDATFHDGTKFDAAAAKANLDRAMLLPESTIKVDLASIDKVEAPNPSTLVVRLKQPDATLLTQFTYKAGMMLSPKSFTGVDVSVPGRQPVCSGPYKFVSRVQNDRIVLEKFDAHYDAKNYFFKRVTFLPIADTTVRLSNLRAGDLDLIERINPTDIAQIKADKSLQLQSTSGVGFAMLKFNLNNGDRAKGNPFADKRVREALQFALDRNSINEVVGGGIFSPAQQPIPPSSPFSSDKYLVVQRNIDKAKALLKEAGQTKVKAEILFPNNTTAASVMEMIQAMASEAGFDLSIRPVQNAALESEAASGNFQGRFDTWSGRLDPSLTITPMFTCKGVYNDGKYCNVAFDKAVADASTTTEFPKRKKLYEQAEAMFQNDLPVILLYYQPWPFAASAKIRGFVPSSDGMIRLHGVSFAQK